GVLQAASLGADAPDDDGDPFLFTRAQLPKRMPASAVAAVTAIPQDPVLFGSSLWFNIDPFNQHLDAALWEALGAVQLKGKVGALQSGLEASMSEFGENFSVGQLQLLCLARWVTAIPQDPVLFGSSLWFNIDPFNQHLDAALWEALGAVQLKGKVGALQSGLEASMSEFGENFSVGQLQLLCLARWVGGLLCCCALLRAA
ncbi:unnamed protein product, partial [Closterium sp. NIES-53]